MSPYIVDTVELVIADDRKKLSWPIMASMPTCLVPNSLDEHKSPAVLRQVASSLADMPANGNTRRNVKPDNKLVRKSRELMAKLADLGTSRQNGRAHTGSSAGRPVYLASALRRIAPIYREC